jgi:hypothetical protein
LLPATLLFADGDHDERRVMYVNSIQIRAGKLSDGEMMALGTAKASGIPKTLPVADVAGQWDFDQGNLAASVGKALEYFGGASTASNLTQFGTTASFGIADINGEVASVMRVPGELSREIGYIMTHGIAPNGGGTRVNQYTIIWDIYVDTSGPTAASLLQISSIDNPETDDGDLFWQGNNFGQGTDGYKGTGQFTAGAWHRVAAAYNMAATPAVVVKYVDGIFQDNWTTGQGLDFSRRALLPATLLFADGDHDERRVMFVNSIQIRSGALSAAELESLGTPQTGGIPIVLNAVVVPSVSVVRTSSGLTLTWQGAEGWKLQTATSLTAASWTDVPGVANNSVTLSIEAGNHFFRLVK